MTSIKEKEAVNKNHRSFHFHPFHIAVNVEGVLLDLIVKYIT